MQLDLISTRETDPVRLAAIGKVTGMTVAGSGKNPLADLIGANWAARKVMIDFSKTDYIDSSAIGWLIHTSSEFGRQGGALVLHSIPPMVKQMLMLLKIGSLIPLKEDEAAAREHLTGGSK